MNKIGEKITLKERTYQIEKFYTRGGQSFIYFANNLKVLNSRVIIKQNEFDDLNELEMLREINHPSLPRIIDSFTEEIDGENYHFLVMEYIDGPTLRSIIETSDIPYIRTLSWAKQLLDILVYLQTPSRGIIHKDICPNNIIVDSSNKIYLIDFGISKKANSTDYIMGGTENYMPPEQFAENGVTDFRSDIYSFSATIYHLLSYNKPEKSVVRKNTIENGFSDPLVPIIDLCNNIPKPLSDLISEGMSIEPDFRPSDANHMKSLLEEVEKGDSFQSFFNYSQTFVPETITITSPTKIKNGSTKIQIPIKHLKSPSKNWGIRKIKKGSEASYSLYFLEDAIEADREEREDVKNRFISIIGRSRIENDIELSKLLSILVSLSKNNNIDDEKNLIQEIQYYRADPETVSEFSNKSIIAMLNEFYQQYSRKIRLYLYRVVLIGIPLLFVIIFSVLYFFYPSSPTVTLTPTPSPVASPVPSKSYVGKKGKIFKNANIRQEASQASADIGTLYADSEVEILDMQHNDSKGKPTIWFRIKVLSYGCSNDNPAKCSKDNPNDADVGWVSSQFISGIQ